MTKTTQVWFGATQGAEHANFVALESEIIVNNQALAPVSTGTRVVFSIIYQCNLTLL
jgi:hypothetical protein